MAKKPKRPMNELEREYKKQRRRIQNFIRRATNRGYEFKKTTPLPKIPKRITEASVRRLENLTPEKLYQQTQKRTETGEIISGTEARKRERQAAARKAAATRKQQIEFFPDRAELNISGFEQEVDKWYGEAHQRFGAPTPRAVAFFTKLMLNADNVRDMLQAQLLQVIAQDGREAVARRIEENWTEISNNIMISMMDYSERGQSALAALMTILKGEKIDMKISIHADELTDSWGDTI